MLQTEIYCSTIDLFLKDKNVCLLLCVFGV